MLFPETVPAVPVALSVSGKTVPTVPVSGSGSVPEPPCNMGSAVSQAQRALLEVSENLGPLQNAGEPHRTLLQTPAEALWEVNLLGEPLRGQCPWMVTLRFLTTALISSFARLFGKSFLFQPFSLIIPGISSLAGKESPFFS